MSCDKCFKRLQVELAAQPGAWLIRCLHNDQIWRNKALLDWFGFHSHHSTWTRALYYCHHEDVPKLEDAISKTIKTSTRQSIQVRVKTDPHRLAHVVLSLGHLRFCSQCGFVISRVAPCAVGPSSPPSQRVHGAHE